MDSKIKDNNINIDFYSEKDREEYTNFLIKTPETNIYHTIEWKEVIENYFNFKPYYLIARDNNEIKAILPFFYLKNLWGKRLESIPLSIYGGAAGDGKYVRLLVKKIFELSDKLKCKYLIIRPQPATYSKLFEQLGMKKIQDKWNHTLKLKDPTIIWQNLDKSNRNSIRQAIKNNVTVEPISDPDMLTEFYRMEFLNRKRFGN